MKDERERERDKRKKNIFIMIYFMICRSSPADTGPSGIERWCHCWSPAA